MSAEDVAAALRAAISLSQTDGRQAYRHLTLALERARSLNNHVGVVLLSSHAAVLCEGLGDLVAAGAHYEEALRHESQDPYLWLAAAGIYTKQGRATDARACLLQVVRCDDPEVGQMAAAIRSQLGDE